MNTIKVYMSYHQLKAYVKGEPVTIKFSFIGPDDVELNVDLNKVVIIYQSQGVVLRKKKFLDYFKRKSAIK